jgi:hypothetical protein
MVKASWRAADHVKMTRGLGLVSLLVSLAIVGMVFSSQLRSGGSKTSSPNQNAIVQQANAVGGDSMAAQAERELEAYRAEHGTFVGATVSEVSGVTVLRAEPTTFCLQIDWNGGVLFDAGPGGTPSAQRC